MISQPFLHQYFFPTFICYSKIKKKRKIKSYTWTKFKNIIMEQETFRLNEKLKHLQIGSINAHNSEYLKAIFPISNPGNTVAGSAEEYYIYIYILYVQPSR